ncbi:MAG: ATP-binding protein [Clostridiales bacterium]|nr:MAG: ATP-binding protein [Clostridiales bacterium]
MMFKTTQPLPKWKLSEGTTIKNVILVMSGKGGVGKSTSTSLLASYMNKKGHNVGILDADITGPSIPKLFGLDHKRAFVVDEKIEPLESENGIKIMSINLLVNEDENAIIWRAPLINGAIKEFYEVVNWGNIDYLIIDLPPGTGDVPLSLMQSVDIMGIILVTTPQELVHLIVKKSENMIKKFHIPILGIIENMSYFTCDSCGKKHYVFGKSELNPDIDILAEIPIDAELRTISDKGQIENYDVDTLFNKEIEKVIR